ncbi:hypothetical protein [Bacillus litorisediminis]|uniref:hypothetical protein n=1 Tax=Bacillus litorisediminis TaxID=2922713 RepID=UPI001FAE9BD7|nr:hypothetical protein [Bacillus litorisediminis]
MKKTNWLIFGFLVILIGMGWLLYQKMTDDTYEGMSIIPEEYEDIPIYEGLEPTEHVYVIDGNRWIDIYEFYLKELPKHGWNIEYEGSVLNDNDPENDWGGFRFRFRKEGFHGELSISAHFNQFEEQTEVIFDKRPIYDSTTWINNVQKSICIYQSINDETCSVINEKNKIKQIAGFINDAIDWNEDVLSRKNTSVIEIGDLNIKVYHENDKEIYFQSEKGTKLMKPDPEFFKLTNLTQQDYSIQ